MTTSADFYRPDASRDLRRLADRARNAITRSAPNVASPVLDLINEVERATATVNETAAVPDVVDRETEDVVDVVYQLPLEVNSAITWYMKKHNITRADLAKRLGVTPGRVSQVLSGDENLTLRTIGTVAQALGAYVNVRLVPEAEVSAAR